MSRKVTTRVVTRDEEPWESRDLANVYDWFVRRILSFPRLAFKFLKWGLPPELAALMSDRLPELVDGVFLTDAGGEKRSDRVLRVWLTTGRPLYVVFEHKSWPDRGTSWQVLGYMVEAQRFAKDAYKQLIPVVGVVIYHGDGRWGMPTKFADLYEMPEVVHPNVVSFTLGVVDLRAAQEADLPTYRELRVLLTLLKHAKMVRRHRNSLDLAERLKPLLVKVVGLRTRVYRGVALVLLRGLVGRAGVISAMLEEVAPQEKENVMWDWTQEHERKGLEKGLKKGRLEGLQEGMEKGYARAVMRMVEKRFGALSSKVRNSILSADTATLETWTDRLAEGADFGAIFASDRQSAKVVALKSKLSVRRSGRSPAA